MEKTCFKLLCKQRTRVIHEIWYLSGSLIIELKNPSRHTENVAFLTIRKNWKQNESRLHPSTAHWPQFVVFIAIFNVAKARRCWKWELKLGQGHVGVRFSSLLTPSIVWFKVETYERCVIFFYYFFFIFSCPTRHKNSS